jgi:hypothetical protein
MSLRQLAFVVGAFSICIACGSTGSYQQLSAGSVGCPPQEIRIRNVDSSIGGATWTARCRDRTYYCAKNSADLGAPRWAGHDAKCTLSSAPESIPDPPRTRFESAIASKKDADTGRTTLRVTLGSEGLRAMLTGEPERDPSQMLLVIARKSSLSVSYEGCRNLEYVSGDQKGALSNAAQYSRRVDEESWETLSAPIARAAVGAIAEGTSAQLRICGDVIDLNQSQVVLLRAFLQRWDEAGKNAPPQPDAPPEAPVEAAAPAVAPPVAEPAVAPPGVGSPAPLAGCQYDNQCKGNRICVEGRCTDPSAGAR